MNRIGTHVVFVGPYSRGGCEQLPVQKNTGGSECSYCIILLNVPTYYATDCKYFTLNNNEKKYLFVLSFIVIL